MTDKDPLEALYDNYKYEEALSASEAVIADAARQSPIGLEIARRVKGDCLRRLGRFQESLHAFEEAIVEARARYNRVALANALRGKGDALRMLNRNDDAFKASEDAIIEARAINDRLALANALRGKGDVLRMLNRYDDAHKVFGDAIIEARAINDRVALAKALCGEGDALRMLNRNDEALKAFEEAIVEARAMNDRVALCRALRGKGEALRMLGRNDDALEPLAGAIIAARESTNPLGLTNALLSEGEALQMLDRNDDALKTFEEAFIVARTINNRLALANALRGKGDALRMLNRDDDALEVLDDALVEARTVKNSFAVANTQIALAEIHEKRNEREKALAAFDEALTLGTTLSYGYATTRAIAGKRRLVSVAMQAQPPRAVPNVEEETARHARSDAKMLTSSDAEIERLHQRVVAIYGQHLVENLPEGATARLEFLQSFLPETRTWTAVLMCDIRGYTTAMSQTDPESQLEILNAYLARGTAIIQGEGGGVDKYMGDAILGFFLPENFSHPSESDRTLTIMRALEAATKLATDPELNRLFEQFRSCYTDLDEKNFGIGVGVACGQAKFGEIGASWRKEYTLIGQSVNQVARIQGCARAGEVACSVECWNHLGATHHFEKLALEYGSDELKQRMKGFETLALTGVRRKPSPA